MKRLILIYSFVLLAGCTLPPPKPPKTQMQIREMQTRVYDNKVGDFLRVMKAVINVLQDDGFIIKNADKDLGFITAVKEQDVSNSWSRGFSMTLGDNNTRYRTNMINECSVNLTEQGKKVRVRATFQRKTLDNFGAAYSIEHVEDLDYYQQFFAKVDKGLYLEKEGF